MDYQSGTDVASALARAHDKLLSSSDDLAGTALFVTQDKSNESPRVTEVFEYIGESMGWKSRTVPQPVVDIVRHGRRAQYAVQSLLAVTAERQDQLPGMPPHVFMDIVNHEQTFDNTLARQVLDWEPELSWKDAIDAILDMYAAGPFPSHSPKPARAVW